MDWTKLQYPLDKDDVLFIEDPRVLWKANRLFEFFPTSHNMGRDEQINATMRLAIIYATIYYPISRDRKAFLPLIGSIIAAIIYRNMNKEGFETDHTFTRAKDLGEPTIIEPTRDNPFMNQLLWSPEDVNSKAMDAMDPNVQEKIRDAYLDNGRNINSDDPYQKDDGFQRFYHVPKMDRDEFAKFLHADKLDDKGKVTSCKQTGGIPCMLDQDPRRSRKPFYQLDDRVKDTMDQATFGSGVTPNSRLQ